MLSWSFVDFDFKFEIFLVSGAFAGVVFISTLSDFFSTTADAGLAETAGAGLTGVVCSIFLTTKVWGAADGVALVTTGNATGVGAGYGAAFSATFVGYGIGYWTNLVGACCATTGTTGAFGIAYSYFLAGATCYGA